MVFYNGTDSERIAKTQIPTDRRVRMILDTDTYCEVDDQIAIAYALQSQDRINLLGITAALFYYSPRCENTADGMEKSYQEILKVLKLAGVESEGFAFRGCPERIKDGQYVESEAVDFIIKTALEGTPEDPLYIVGIGACTNIASAILKNPDIMDRIVVVWLGGHAYEWQDNREFNLGGDLEAGKILFDCGVPLIQVPACGVTEKLKTSVPELKEYLCGVNKMGDFLVQNVIDYVLEYRGDYFAWSKALWDIGPVALLVNPEWASQKICTSPVIATQDRYSFDPRRHLIRYVYNLNRDEIFKDMILKIRDMK